MATVTPASAQTPSTANASSYAGAAFTPAVNDLVVVVFSATGTVDTGADATDNQGGTYTLLATATRTSAHSIYVLVRDTLVSSAVSHTVTCTLAVDPGTGAEVQTFVISGMGVAGATAMRQAAIQNNNTGGTPAPVFASAALTGNPLIGGVSAASSPPALTPPSGWTEAYDHGHASPTGGTESVYRSSGFTSTTVTWGSSTGTVDFGAVVVEFDASGVTNASPVTTTVAAVAAISTPAITLLTAPTIATVAAVAAIDTPQVTATTGEGANVFLTDVAAVTAIATPTVTASALAVPTTVAAVAAIATPTVTAGASISVSATVAAVAAVATPAASIGQTITPTTVAAVAAVDMPGSPIPDQDALVRSSFWLCDQADVALDSTSHLCDGLDNQYLSVAATVTIPTPAVTAAFAPLSLTTVAAAASVPTPTIAFPSFRHSSVMRKHRDRWVQQGNVPRRKEAPRRIRA
jgi:hypothetical protein